MKTLLALSQTLDAILDTADCDPKTMMRLEELNNDLYKAAHPECEDDHDHELQKRLDNYIIDEELENAWLMS